MFFSQKPGLFFGFLAFLLIIVGLVVLTSASAPFAYQKFSSAYYFLKHQTLYGFLPGVFLFLIFWKINYLKFQKFYKLIFLFCLVLLALVFIPGLGESFGRARSWIAIGPVSLQPSEFVKLGLIIFLAGFLVKVKYRFPTGSGANYSLSERFSARGGSVLGRERSALNCFIRYVRSSFLTYFLFVTLICGLILFQPDIGTAFLIGLIAVTLYFLAGGKLLHLSILGLLAGGVLAFLIKIAPYRLARLTAFFNPSFDPQGIGYHINQALIAIGSGGFFGLGLGHSRQKFQYLPEVVGDSIFAIMGEELGFFLSAVFIILFFIFLRQGFKIAAGAKDKFGYYLACGVVIWFGWQMILNVGSMLGILPLTGLTLPFISYGGSSLAASMAAVGLVMNISKNNS